MEDLKEIETRGGNIVLLGDMNRAIGAGQWGVAGNKTNISYGGQLLRDLLATERYVLLNGLTLAQGGPWTWVDRSNSAVKSCLDLGIVSAGLVPFVTTFLIDKEQQFTPMRGRKTKNGIKSTYSDHFSVELIFTGLQRAGRADQEEEEERSDWNLRKIGGWEEYEKQTDNIASKVESILENEDISVDERMRRIEKVDNKAKFAAFG